MNSRVATRTIFAADWLDTISMLGALTPGINFPGGEFAKRLKVVEGGG
jgi:hypothetical protein